MNFLHSNLRVDWHFISLLSYSVVANNIVCSKLTKYKQLSAMHMSEENKASTLMKVKTSLYISQNRKHIDFLGPKFLFLY